MDSNNLIKQLLMVGIGTTSLMAEKLKEVSDQWVQDGKLNSDQAQNFVDDLMQQVKSEQGNFELWSTEYLAFYTSRPVKSQ